MSKHLRFYTLLLLGLGVLLLLLQQCMVQRLDSTPYKKTSYYKATLSELQQEAPAVTTGDTLQAGWAKINITPPVGTPLAGYGKRLGMEYEQVHDSAWVRTFAFSNGASQAYLVALDMLIVPMSVNEQLARIYPKYGLTPDQVYLTATHTHTSFGGWQKNLAGHMMAGKYSEEVVQETVQHIIESILQAKQRMQPVRVGYGQADAGTLVQNRLTGSAVNLDSMLRFVRFEQASGKIAVLASFSAHPTILPSMQPILSRDYPGELVDALEEHVDFAAFAAGAVGSHQAVYTNDTFESTARVGRELAAIILQALPQLPTAYTRTLGSVQTPLYLPPPQWRLGEQSRFRPSLFYTFFGKYEASVSALQVGNIVLLGVPADYSGEFMPQLVAQAAKQNQHVLVTSFNGGYLGYLIPDEHYDLDKYEARDMNFYGPHAGNYLTDVLLHLLKTYTPAKTKYPKANNAH